MPTLADLRAARADGARIQAEPRDATHSWRYVGELAAAGFRTAVVLDADAFPDTDYAAWAEWHALHYAAEFFVVGNEPDAYLLPVPSPESWSMQPPVYAALWAACAPAIKRARPAAQVIVGGLVSGQVAYLEELLPLLDPTPDGIDVHPYNQSVASGRALLRAYRALLP